MGEYVIPVLFEGIDFKNQMFNTILKFSLDYDSEKGVKDTHFLLIS